MFVREGPPATSRRPKSSRPSERKLRRRPGITAGLADADRQRQGQAIGRAVGADRHRCDVAPVASYVRRPCGRRWRPSDRPGSTPASRMPGLSRHRMTAPRAPRLDRPCARLAPRDVEGHDGSRLRGREGDGKSSVCSRDARGGVGARFANAMAMTRRSARLRTMDACAARAEVADAPTGRADIAPVTTYGHDHGRPSGSPHNAIVGPDGLPVPSIFGGPMPVVRLRPVDVAECVPGRSERAPNGCSSSSVAGPLSQRRVPRPAEVDPHDQPSSFSRGSPMPKW